VVEVTRAIFIVNGERSTSGWVLQPVSGTQPVWGI
jgi:hypothetical protein